MLWYIIGNDTLCLTMITNNTDVLFCVNLRKRVKFMPKTKFQNIIFTLIMAFIMVYAMICYNISLNKGQMSNEVFLLAFHEMVIMWPAAFILEFFAVEKLATKLAFRFIRPGVDNPFFITLAISSMIVCIMCPTMSMIATLLFKNPGKEIVAVWLQTTAMNFPMALCWQIFLRDRLARLIFRTIFKTTSAIIKAVLITAF